MAAPTKSPRHSSIGDILLHTTSGIIFDLLTVDDLLLTTMEKVIEVTGATTGYLIALDAKGELSFRAARPPLQPDVRPRISRRLIRDVIARGETVLTPNAVADPRYGQSNSVTDMSLKSIICAPLRSEREVFGVIYLENHLTEGQFDASHRETVQRLAEMASIALRMTQTYADVRSERDRLAEENRGLREIFRAEYEFGRFIGRSPAMARFADQLTRVADTDFTVLIHGESGTGKELVARVIHSSGPRRERPFVAINSAAVPSNLFESELFGHAAGAFTGAQRARVGRAEAADGGTLFLDEIGDTPLEMQPKLLRLLQEKTFERVGENRTRKADIRILSATHKDLKKEVQSGRFREDLYFRLNELVLTLPPLRDRREDIEELANHFLRESGRDVRTFTPSAMAALREHPWPGNVRELRSAVRRAATYTNDGEPIDLEVLRTCSVLEEGLHSVPTAHGRDASPAIPIPMELPHRQAMATFEAAYLAEAIRRHPGLKRDELAEKLRMSRRTFFSRLRKYGLTGTGEQDP